MSNLKQMETQLEDKIVKLQDKLKAAKTELRLLRKIAGTTKRRGRPKKTEE
jgi:hypothetical protein